MYPGANIQITSAVARRLVSLVGKRYAIPVSPLPPEGFADVLFRAYCINGGPPPNTRTVNHNTRVDDRELESLSELLGTPNGISDLKSLIYPEIPGRFPNQRNVRHVDFFGSFIPRSMMMNRRRVAPRSISVSLVSKAMWHIGPLSFDAQTHEELIDYCPGCNKSLDFQYSGGVNRCRRCGPKVDLRRYEQRIIPFSDVEAVHFYTGLIDPEKKDDRDRPKLHADLSSENRGDIFTLCTKIAELITTHGNREIPVRRRFGIPPENIEIAARAVLSWPGGVIQVMDSIEEGAIPRDKAGRICNGKLEVRAARSISPTLARSLREVHQTYKVKIGSLLGQSRGAGIDEINLLEIARATRPYQKVCRVTGLSSLVLFGCFRSGFFGAPCADNLCGEDFRAWTDRLKIENLELREEQGKIALGNFVKASFHGNGDPWPSILNGVLEHRLPLVKPSSQTKRISDLQIADLCVWIDFLREINGVAHENLVVRKSDAAFFLNMRSHRRVESIFSREVTFKELHDFDRNFIKLSELCDRLALRGETLGLRSIAVRLDRAGIAIQHRNHSATWRSRCDTESYFGL